MPDILDQLQSIESKIDRAKSVGDNRALQSLYTEQYQLSVSAAPDLGVSVPVDTPIDDVLEGSPVLGISVPVDTPIVDDEVTVGLTDTVKSPENTGVDFTAINTEEKYQNSEIVGPTDSDLGMLGINTDLPTNAALGELGLNTDKITPGAIPPSPRAATVNIKDSKGSIKKDDLRVKIRVPVLDYLGWETTNGPNEELVKLGGIIFPYTPNISYEHKADYASVNPTHSNFTQYFYKNSSISPISISGKFTVQNEKDAGVYLATVHLLRALIKMRSGGSQTGDPDSGAPPPVCRLDAYGDFMLKNVPVVISSFKIELPEGIDYFVLGKLNSGIYKQASVPTVSTISITCNPVYSRNEMQKFSVTGWLRDANSRKAGYL